MCIMAVSKTCDDILFKIKTPNPSQESPASSKAQNQDLKEMDVLCTFKIKKESLNLDHECIKDQWPYQNQNHYAIFQSGTSSLLKIPEWGHQDMVVLCTFKMKKESKNLEYGCIKDQWPYQNEDQAAKLPSQEPPAPIKAPNRDLKDMDILCSFKIKIKC